MYYFTLLVGGEKELICELRNYLDSARKCVLNHLCGKRCNVDPLDAIETGLECTSNVDIYDHGRVRDAFCRLPVHREAIYAKYGEICREMTVGYDLAARQFIREKHPGAQVFFSQCVDVMRRDDDAQLREFVESEKPDAKNVERLILRALETVSSSCLQVLVDREERIELTLIADVHDFEVDERRVAAMRQLLQSEKVVRNSIRDNYLAQLVCCWRGLDSEQTYTHGDLHLALERLALRSVWVLTHKCGLHFEDCCYELSIGTFAEDAEADSEELFQFGYDTSLNSDWLSATWCAERVVQSRRPITERVRKAYLQSQVDEDEIGPIETTWLLMREKMTLTLEEVRKLSSPQLVMMWDDIPETVLGKFLASKEGRDTVSELMQTLRERWSS